MKKENKLYIWKVMDSHEILNFKISTNFPDSKAMWLSFGKAARSVLEIDQQRKDELRQACVDTVRDCLKSFTVTGIGDFKVEYSDRYIGLGSFDDFSTSPVVHWLDTIWPMEREDVEFFRDVFSSLK